MLQAQEARVQRHRRTSESERLGNVFVPKTTFSRHKKRRPAEARLRVFLNGVVDETRTRDLLGHNQAL